MNMGTQGYQPAPRRSGMTTAGKWIFIVGLVLSLLAVAGTAWGITRAASMASSFEAESLQLESGSGTVPMDEGDSRMIFASAGQTPTCTVTAPDGSTVDVESPGDLPTDVAQDGLEMVGAFSAAQAGEHSLECTGPVEVSPPLGGGDIAAFATMAISLLALIPLGLLTLLGLVLWLVGRNRDRKALQAPVSTSSGYGYGYPEGGTTQGYPQAGYPQAGRPAGQVDETTQAYRGQGYQPGSSAPPPPPPPPAGYGRVDDGRADGTPDGTPTDQR